MSMLKSTRTMAFGALLGGALLVGACAVYPADYGYYAPAQSVVYGPPPPAPVYIAPPPLSFSFGYYERHGGGYRGGSHHGGYHGGGHYGGGHRR